jgi:hypothetical protein
MLHGHRPKRRHYFFLAGSSSPTPTGAGVIVITNAVFNVELHLILHPTSILIQNRWWGARRYYKITSPHTSGYRSNTRNTTPPRQKTLDQSLHRTTLIISQHHWHTIPIINTLPVIVNTYSLCFFQLLSVSSSTWA